MRKIILTALMAASVIPAAAQAQDRHDDHRGPPRYDQRHDPRNDPRGGPGYRDDRNHNWGRDDWRGYRNGNRNLYARGNWRAPFGYHNFRPGLRIGAQYYGPRYVIADPWRYRLPPAHRYESWVRHYDDVLLIDTRRGTVMQVIHGFYN